MRLRLGLAIVLIFAVCALAAPVWLPSLGTALTEDDPLLPADAALVLEGTGGPGHFRRRSVAAARPRPHRGHRRGAGQDPRAGRLLERLCPLGPGRAAPHTHRISARRARSIDQAGEQAQAALPALQADQAHTVVVLAAGASAHAWSSGRSPKSRAAGHRTDHRCASAAAAAILATGTRTPRTAARCLTAGSRRWCRT